MDDVAARFLLAIALVVAALSASGPTARTRPAPPGDRLSVRDLGAKGDGRTDDTRAFQRALNLCRRRGGGIVRVPSGRYLIAQRLVVPDNVTLEGNWRAPATFDWKAPRLEGSVLLAVADAGKPDGPPFLTLNSNSTVKGLTVFYPNQKKTNPPVAYPWMIATAKKWSINAAIVDVLLLNSYQAVDFGSNLSARHYIRNLNAQAIYRGIYVDQCGDVARLENVHLWPFWSLSLDDEVAKFTFEHGQGFIFGRTDWELVTNCFAIGYGVGFRFTQHAPKDVSRSAQSPNYANPSTGNVMVTGGGPDLCNTAVLVEGSQAHAGVSFANCQIYGDLIVRPTNAGMVRFTGCGFFGSKAGRNGVGLARLDAGRSRVSFSNCHFYALQDHRDKPLIDMPSGRLGMANCFFLNSERTHHEGPAGWVPREHLALGPGVISAVVQGCEFTAPARIANASKGQVVLSDNVENTDAAPPMPDRER